ncbi:MAG: biopolymer transporter ExbD [Elusimicrobia bacterium]|nr:biopolymer transporter ExbD [Elusimicrobiota bacterium]
MTDDVRRRITGDGAIAGINIVPVIDLCLVLLVILLIISPLLEKVPVEVNLPKAHAHEEKENSLSVTISPDGKIALNTDLVERKDLTASVRALLRLQGENVLVIVRSDENVSYGDLTDVLKEIKDAGAKNIAVGTQLIQDKAGS